MKIYLIAMILLIGLHVKAQEYPMMVLEEGHILVEVKLNDSIKANFILDTGAGAIVLSSKTFSRVKETSKEAGYFTGFRHDGDRLDGEIFSIPSLAFGEYKMQNILVGVYPPLDDFGIDGLLSLKFFENKPFTLDYKNQKIKLLRNDDLEELATKNTVIPLSPDVKEDISLDVHIPICINGELEVSAEFDTGSGHSLFLVNPYFLKKLALDSASLTSKVYTTPIAGRTLNDYVAPINSVAVCTDESIRWNEKPTIFREGLIFEALIGSGLFKDRAITIDIPGKRMIIHQM
ncbi:MAG: retropepsin-like aspartic protease [Cyclobacteriaceae bacterium]